MPAQCVVRGPRPSSRSYFSPCHAKPSTAHGFKLTKRSLYSVTHIHDLFLLAWRAYMPHLLS